MLNVKLLVNASGFGKMGEFIESSPESNAGMCDLNLKALILTTQTVLPYIKEEYREYFSKLLPKKKRDAASEIVTIPYIVGITNGFNFTFFFIISPH